jgi:hypothetical protein
MKDMLDGYSFVRKSLEIPVKLWTVICLHQQQEY